MTVLMAPAALDAQGIDTRVAERRARERVRARANTRRVRRLRLAVPIFSAVIGVGLIGVAVLPKLLPIAALSGLSITADGLVMNTPRLAGHLGEGRRYEVTARRAVQSLLYPTQLSLDDLAANLDLGEEAVTIEGRHAAYDTGTEILKLTEGVAIRTTDGNAMDLSAANVDLRAGEMHATGGLTIDSPRGTVEAGAIHVLMGGDVIRFTGGVKITVEPQKP